MRWAALRPCAQNIAARASFLDGTALQRCVVRQPSQRAALGAALRAAQRCRGFATAVFQVKADGPAPEQTLFVVGLNEGKFFGQDGSEEGLKLLERVAEHHKDYELLFGLTEKELAEIEKEHKVKKNKLTPSKELQDLRNCEMIPLVQAGMVDSIKRRALDRELKTTQNHIAWQLWQHPREALSLYRVFWRKHIQRRRYKDVARRQFFSGLFPISAQSYFEECADVIAIRAALQLVRLRSQGEAGACVLAVRNELFSLVAEQLRELLNVEAPRKFGSPEFCKQLDDRAKHLLVDVPDLTPVVTFVYIGLPIILLHFVFLGLQFYGAKLRGMTRVLEPEQRE